MTLEDIYVSESLQTINRVVDVNERWFSIYLDSDHVSDGSRIPSRDVGRVRETMWL